mmetsp:Transcript_44560/g.104110  ORF Transcript_44560/g.104110 Transcript_44560/m.104110 type:complete len:232 (+) Transcript_44560:69-764(+)
MSACVWRARIRDERVRVVSACVWCARSCGERVRVLRPRSEEILQLVTKHRQVLCELVPVFRLEVGLNFMHQLVEGGGEFLLPLGAGGLLREDRRLPLLKEGVVGEDEGKQRTRERPLVGAVLEHDHVEEHRQLRRKELGLAREVVRELLLGPRVALVRELPEVVRGEVLERRGALRRDGDLVRLEALLQRRADVPEHRRVELDEHRRVVAHQQLHQREVCLAHLGVRHDVL